MKILSSVANQREKNRIVNNLLECLSKEEIELYRELVRRASNQLSRKMYLIVGVASRERVALYYSFNENFIGLSVVKHSYKLKLDYLSKEFEFRLLSLYNDWLASFLRHTGLYICDKELESPRKIPNFFFKSRVYTIGVARSEVTERLTTYQQNN